MFWKIFFVLFGIEISVSVQSIHVFILIIKSSKNIIFIYFQTFLFPANSIQKAYNGSFQLYHCCSRRQQVFLVSDWTHGLFRWCCFPRLFQILRRDSGIQKVWKVSFKMKNSMKNISKSENAMILIKIFFIIWIF